MYFVWTSLACVQVFEREGKGDFGHKSNMKGVRKGAGGKETPARRILLFTPGECQNPDWSVFKTCQSQSEYVFLNRIG